MNAVIASCSEYTYLTQGKRIDGTMYSCTSLGVKIGGGIGTAVVGWMLEFSGWVLKYFCTFLVGKEIGRAHV